MSTSYPCATTTPTTPSPTPHPSAPPPTSSPPPLRHQHTKIHSRPHDILHTGSTDENKEGASSGASSSEQPPLTNALLFICAKHAELSVREGGGGAAAVPYFKQLVHASSTDSFQRILQASPIKLQNWVKRRPLGEQFQCYCPVSLHGKTTSAGAESINRSGYCALHKLA